VAGLAERFGCTVKRTYGSTEAPTVTTSIPGDPPDRARETDGHALGEVELVLGDPATGAQLDPGSDTGEIWLRGPELFVGYADRTYTEKVIVEPGGWFRTGDLGALDDGWLTVMGRLSDIIIRSGENISASEVEAVLESHPAVRQAVAVGIPDAATGERVAAAVSTSGHFDLATCREWFRSQGITMFKTPELILVLPQIPTLAAGKPDRAAIRALAASEGAPAPRDA
jgi:acyl-CoA synthetase (AMP-forming)/AMP-acid ligase II